MKRSGCGLSEIMPETKENPVTTGFENLTVEEEIGVLPTQRPNSATAL